MFKMAIEVVKTITAPSKYEHDEPIYEDGTLLKGISLVIKVSMLHVDHTK
jgi:hypothetical protein